MITPLLAPMLTSTRMAAIFSDLARLQAMLEMEAALAGALADSSLCTGAAAETIATFCRAERFDQAAIAAAAAESGTLAVPLVKHLTFLVAASDPEAAKIVHLGATSQDVVDTGLTLQARAALTVIAVDLDRAIRAGLDAMARHRDTVLPGRTLMQQAVPVTFGLKIAGIVDALLRYRERLYVARTRAIALQFGGASGTLAALGEKSLAVAAALARRLDLPIPDMPWHGARDRFIELGAFSAGLVATAAKFARDLSLMAQTEVGEAFEPAVDGRGGSSAMPHKRNPVLCAEILAAHALAPNLLSSLIAGAAGEHERALGGWQAEGESLPVLLALAGGTCDRLADLLEGVTVDAERMRRNLDATRGLVMAEAVQTLLAKTVGKAEAHRIVEAACRRAIEVGCSLRETLAEDGVLAGAALDEAMDPTRYLGAAGAFVDRVAARARAALE